MISMTGFVNKQGQTAHTVERQRQRAKIKKSKKKQKKRNMECNETPKDLMIKRTNCP